MSDTRIVLVRHGESIVTVKRILGGPRSCVGLTELGREQATRLRDRLATNPEFSVDLLMSSGYPRALQTAEILVPALGGIDIHIDTGFGEHDPGPECDGMTYEEFVRRHGRPDWSADPHREFFPGGETIAQFHERVNASLDTMLRHHAGKTILIACHGGVVDAVLRRILRTSQTGGFEVRTKNCSMTELHEVRSGHWALLRYNDHAHLHGLAPATQS